MKATLQNIMNWARSMKVSRLGKWIRAPFARVDAKSGSRVLVHEILSLQVFSAALAGVLAIASLYWGGQWVLQDNYSRWALQWTQELNELGAPLFLADDSEALLRLESFVKRYPEIDRVAYYGRDGTMLFTVGNDDGAKSVTNLPSGALKEAVNVVGDKNPFLMSTGILNPQRFEILAPVWKESIPDDGLFDFDPTLPQQPVKTELLGFVSINLDFVIFHDRLLANIKGGILILLVVLVAFALYGRHALRNALKAISNLQEPIKELAKGNLQVEFEPAEHREIAEIVEALETTASALNARDAELLQLANHDSLTGLFNRRRFLEELRKEALKIMHGGHESALFFVDLDQFKYINDACGHPAGDRLIRKVADELLRSVGQDDVVARFGGDEFAILVPHTDEAGARLAAETLLANMRRMAHIEDERVFHVHCSIGITMLTEENILHDELINQADIACREAKMAGRNRMHVFEQSVEAEQQTAADIGWMTRLRNALDNDEFELRFQPINRVDTGETTHHEVLIRLPGDDGNMILPDVFLPSAVRFGLMSEIDFWMIRNAAEAYERESASDSDLKLAINLSANAFENEDLTSYVAAIFDKHNVAPGNIVFEITESLAVRRPIHVERQIAELRELGCELALDDFGTGYSSFSYLQKLHFDYIKIDGAFVKDLPNNPVDQKMIRLIAEIGREAGMKTVAEYVQNAETLALLADLGVDLAQGFFVGRPAKKPRRKSTPILLKSRRTKKGAR
ncbi:MAG: EAL domain-containing protein [Gammaproteobacteria bacterium]|nr:EAL domain-containing protein [Gammaproteobacteria bacterium]